MMLAAVFDWDATFRLDVPLASLVVRASAVYLLLFLIFRVALNREVGELAVTDLLVVVLIADAAQNGMSANYTSVTSGAVVVLTIVGWSLLLNLATYHFPALERILKRRPVLLVRDGRLLLGNMRRQLITRDELASQLRLQGHDDPSQIHRAWMEPDGRISVVGRDDASRSPQRREA